MLADLVRDEAEPERSFRDLLGLFDRDGVDAAFWFTFAGYELPHRPADPGHDLDLASNAALAAHHVLQPRRLRPDRAR